jgi:hypothetical protein
MPQSLACIDVIAVATAMPGDGDKPGFLQLSDNFLHGTFGDAHIIRHTAQACFIVACQANQHVAMVAEQCPIAHLSLTLSLLNIRDTPTMHE